MAWCRTGDKPLLEPILLHFTAAYMQHQGEMSQQQARSRAACHSETIKNKIVNLLTNLSIYDFQLAYITIQPDESNDKTIPIW